MQVPLRNTMEDVKIEKLLGKANWTSWKFQMSIILKSMDIFGVVDGTWKKPSEEGGGDAEMAVYLKKLQEWEKKR